MSKLSIKQQKGETLILTLLTLLVLFLGILYISRNVLVEAQMTGNTVARQRNAQTGDLALRIFENNIQTVANNTVLQISASDQPWYRDITVAPGNPAPAPAAPDPNYWSTCYGNSDATKRCDKITGATYNAYVVAQPTGRTDPQGCGGGVTQGGASQLTAVYYDLFVHVVESSGTTSATNETVYKLCVN